MREYSSTQHDCTQLSRGKKSTHTSGELRTMINWFVDKVREKLGKGNFGKVGRIYRLAYGSGSGFCYARKKTVFAPHHITKGAPLYIEDAEGAMVKLEVAETRPRDDLDVYGERAKFAEPTVGSLYETICPDGGYVQMRYTGTYKGEETFSWKGAIADVEGWSGLPIIDVDDDDTDGYPVYGLFSQHRTSDADTHVETTNHTCVGDEWSEQALDFEGEAKKALTMKCGITDLVARTGSGKSTRFPIALAKKGSRVLLLSSRRATVEDTYEGIRRNYASVSFKHGGGSSRGLPAHGIMVMTYGRFLVDPNAASNYDILLADECHDRAVDVQVACEQLEVMASRKRVIRMTATSDGKANVYNRYPTEYVLAQEGEDGDGVMQMFDRVYPTEELRDKRCLIHHPTKAGCERIVQKLLENGLKAEVAYRGSTEALVKLKTEKMVVVATSVCVTGLDSNPDVLWNPCMSNRVTTDYDDNKFSYASFFE
ncbi:hypothetical protein EGW08_007451 [Elysia chlorotica]|uniref:Helicase ATP-binding domain-containing protein n=1 Tax=Elysia chlorotica TaxID=188477 RepID=A0A433TT68_ELYCH|nr:hypothetical protein EGW08_007451 [Elysia chlorotica]